MFINCGLLPMFGNVYLIAFLICLFLSPPPYSYTPFLVITKNVMITCTGIKCDGTTGVGRKIGVTTYDTQHYQPEHQPCQQQEQQVQQHQQPRNSMTCHTSHQLQQQQIKQHQPHQSQHQEQGHDRTIYSLHQLQQQQRQELQQHMNGPCARPPIPNPQIQQTTHGSHLTRNTIIPNVRSTPLLRAVRGRGKGRRRCYGWSKGRGSGKGQGKVRDMENISPLTIRVAPRTSAMSSSCPPGATNTYYNTSLLHPSPFRVVCNKNTMSTHLSVPSSQSQMTPKAVSTQLSLPSGQSLVIYGESSMMAQPAPSQSSVTPGQAIVIHNQNPTTSKPLPTQSLVTSSQPLVICCQPQIFSPQVVISTTLAASGKSTVTTWGRSVIAGRGEAGKGGTGTVAVGGYRSSVVDTGRVIPCTTLNLMSTPSGNHNVQVPEECKVGSGSSAQNTLFKRKGEESGMESGSSSVVHAERVQRSLIPVPASGIKLLFLRSNKRVCV